MTFAVITKVPTPPGESGNLAVAMDVYVQPDPKDHEHIVTIGEFVGNPMIMLLLRRPVFTLGEILILDELYGREVVGQQRKPAKWDVEVEHFENLDAALDRATRAIW